MTTLSAEQRKAILRAAREIIALVEDEPEVAPDAYRLTWRDPRVWFDVVACVIFGVLLYVIFLR